MQQRTTGGGVVYTGATFQRALTGADLPIGLDSDHRPNDNTMGVSVGVSRFCTKRGAGSGQKPKQNWVSK